MLETSTVGEDANVKRECQVIIYFYFLHSLQFYYLLFKNIMQIFCFKAPAYTTTY